LTQSGHCGPNLIGFENWRRPNLTAEGYVRRREFIKVIAGSMVVWPLAARAQPLGKPATIGLLLPNTVAVDAPRVGALMRRLRELGWIEGRNIAVEYRWAEGRTERLTEFAAEFVRLQVDVIVTSATTTSLAVKQATSTIPIVFAAVGDPVGAGLVASLARPGGNVTGFSLQQSDTASKRLEMLRDVVPGLHQVAIIANIDNASAMLDMREALTAARKFGLETVKLEIRRPEDIAAAIDALKVRANALYVCNDPLVATNRVRISTLALGARLPTMFNAEEYVEAGGLLSYGPNFPDLYRRTAEYVDRILRGTKPADLPIEQPTKFDLIVNLTTAKALGLTISESFLIRADRVIE
jgi:putative tryptophan/tyrosine transport system substrate-binding protein